MLTCTEHRRGRAREWARRTPTSFGPTRWTSKRREFWWKPGQSNGVGFMTGFSSISTMAMPGTRLRDRHDLASHGQFDRDEIVSAIARVYKYSKDTCDICRRMRYILKRQRLRSARVWAFFIHPLPQDDCLCSSRHGRPSRSAGRSGRAALLRQHPNDGCEIISGSRRWMDACQHTRQAGTASMLGCGEPHPSLFSCAAFKSASNSGK